MYKDPQDVARARLAGVRKNFDAKLKVERQDRAALTERARGMYADPARSKLQMEVHAAASRTVGYVHPDNEQALADRIWAERAKIQAPPPPTKEALLAAELAKLTPK